MFYPLRESDISVQDSVMFRNKYLNLLEMLTKGIVNFKFKFKFLKYFQRRIFMNNWNCTLILGFV